MMKVYRWFLVTTGMLCALFFMSCSKKDDTSANPELVISTEKLSFSNTTESKSFYIKSNTNWQIENLPDWIKVDPSSGGAGTIKIDVQSNENTSATVRTANLDIRAGTLKKQLALEQSVSSAFKADQSSLETDFSAHEIALKIQSLGTYTFSSDQDWIERKSQPTASNNQYTETLSLTRNGNHFDRKATLTFTKGSEKFTVTVNQKGNALETDAVTIGMSSNAVTLASKMKIGWNLGNALESTSGVNAANETSWGNPKTSVGLIKAVKAAGFNAIRIPCAWSGYIQDQTTYQIKDSWLARVQEVVDYAISNDMYVILNIHWDGGWLEEHPDYANQAAVNKKQKALWQQIAVYFRDYDEHLIFAGTNEVHAGYSTPTTENNIVQQSYNQTFVDAVRATGGKNAVRNLVVQSYNTNIQYAVDFLKMPNDQANQRLMTEVHFYDPWDFAGDENSNVYLWGKAYNGNAHVSTWGQEDWADSSFKKMKESFGDKGIPVILGEYGAILRSNVGSDQALHLKARNAYLTYITKIAHANSIVPFYWDNGNTGNSGFGLFNRSTYQIVQTEALAALMEGIK